MLLLIYCVYGEILLHLWHKTLAKRKIIKICVLFCKVGIILCLIQRQIHVHVNSPALLRYDNNEICI